ncbi:hypothetical protein ACFFV7_18295 [Nonomuraea spiralis]|uniref:Uncharacterized protein n=1 Tax=Nonomuraea spiralis TaxID=46182 RepID=A0ABV5IF57_9ACTN|nr:hypothetical protein [Nonomuraea spiralis]GGS70942.1 hypothetical protein GCM10010176_012180 [Nonomuraea spiralis]
MDGMQVLAHRTAMGFRGSLHAALPGAPRRRLPERVAVRARLASSLRRTADRLDPACRPARYREA